MTPSDSAFKTKTFRRAIDLYEYTDSLNRAAEVALAAFQESESILQRRSAGN